MLYLIIGTEKNKRDKAYLDLKKEGEVTRILYKEHMDELEYLIDANNMFSKKEVVVCVQLCEESSSKEKVLPFLLRIKNSPNVFIIDEPFVGVSVANELIKNSHKVYDAREEKKKDNTVFSLCDAFTKRDKKEAWRIFMEIRNNKEGESIQGALWWKFQIIWQKTKEGKKTGFTKEECESFGKDIVMSPILAHSGKGDLMIMLEKIILSL